jgi:hypothetical protein
MSGRKSANTKRLVEPKAALAVKQALSRRAVCYDNNNVEVSEGRSKAKNCLRPDGNNRAASFSDDILRYAS